MEEKLIYKYILHQHRVRCLGEMGWSIVSLYSSEHNTQTYISFFFLLVSLVFLFTLVQFTFSLSNDYIIYCYILQMLLLYLLLIFPHSCCFLFTRYCPHAQCIKKENLLMTLCVYSLFLHPAADGLSFSQQWKPEMFNCATDCVAVEKRVLTKCRPLQVLHNVALVEAELGNWEKAQENLVKALDLRTDAKLSLIDRALESTLVS